MYPGERTGLYMGLCYPLDQNLWSGSIVMNFRICLSVENCVEQTSDKEMRSIFEKVIRHVPSLPIYL